MTDNPMFVSMLIGVGVIVLVGGVGLVVTGSFGKIAEQRLEGLTSGTGKRKREQLVSGILLRPTAINLGAGRSGQSSFPTPRISTCCMNRPM